jgi:hypothetical protein
MTNSTDSATPPALVWVSTRLGELGELRFEIHIADRSIT